MNTKISEKQIEKSKAKSGTKSVDKAIMPGPAYFVILATTVILLLSFTVAFFAVFAKDKAQGTSHSNDVDINSPSENNQSSGDSKNPSGTVIGGGVSVGGNYLGRTSAKRSNYVSKASTNVNNISDVREVDNVILVDLDTYESVAEKFADTKIYPASMTKVMSLLVACENLKSLNTKLTVTKEVIDYAYEMEGSLFGVKKGDKLSTQDLLYLTSYYSDTVAVVMLAEHISGSEDEFVKLMNAKAREIGLKNTNFDNCTGLHSEDNYTTCREMAAIMAYALEHPLCKELLTSTKAYKIYINDEHAYTLWSPSWYRERLSSQPKLNTVTVTGGKTGYIDESGFCLVSYAVGSSSGKRYIQVVVGDTRSSENVKYVYNNFAN